MPFLLDLTSITPEYIATLPFVTLDQRQHLPKLAGVYVIYVYSSKSNKPKILYVGKSEDLNQRLDDHNLLPQLRLLQCVEIAVCIAYLSLDIPFGDVGIIESVFINKLSPYFNVQHRSEYAASRCRTVKIKHKIQAQLKDAECWRDDEYASSKGIRELKKEASKLGVSRYSYMSKTQLVTAINQIKSRHAVT